MIQSIIVRRMILHCCKYALHNDTFRDVAESHFYSTPGTNVHRMGLRIIVPCLRICRIQASPVERSWVVKPVTPLRPDIAWPALLRFTTGVHPGNRGRRLDAHQGAAHIWTRRRFITDWAKRCHRSKVKIRISVRKWPSLSKIDSLQRP